MIENYSNKIYYGNLLWVFEALKVVDKDIDFDQVQLENNIQDPNCDLLIYDCIVFNEDKEDSLYFQRDGVLYEYFSNNKCELILKLIKLYQNKSSKDNHSIINHPKKITKDSHVYDVTSKDKLTANILLTYKSGKTRWVYNYELKKLFFYLKFLPNYMEIKLIRLFPVHVKTLNKIFTTYVDKEDHTGNDVNFLQEKAIEDKILKNFVSKMKHIFYEKFLLMLKKLDLEMFEHEGKYYVHDIRDIQFAKYDSKHIKLACERKYIKYKEQHKYKDPNLHKDIPNAQDIAGFFDAMMTKYDEMKKASNLNDHLNVPPSDKTSDIVFKVLRPQCPYTLSQLMEDEIKVKNFVYHVNNKNKFK